GGVSDPEIRAQVFEADGTAVTGAFKVNSSDAGAQTNAVVARLAGGGFVVAWEDRNPAADGSGSAIRFQAYSADDNPSGGEHLANTTAAFDQSLPSVAGLEGGGFVVTWSDASVSGTGTNGLDVRGQLFSAAGDAVGGEFLVNTITNRSQTASSVVGLPGGGFAVAWEDDSPQGEAVSGQTTLDYGSDIAIQIFNASASKVGGQQMVDDRTPGAVFTFNGSGRVTAMNPSATLLPDGKIAVAWIDTYDQMVRTRVLNGDGSPAGAVVDAGRQVGLSNPAPAIAVLAGGGYAVGWSTTQSDVPGTSGQEVLARAFDAAGATQGAAFRVDTDTVGEQRAPAILGASDGGFLVAWQDGATSDIRAQSFAASDGAIGDIALSVGQIGRNAVENVQAAIVSASGAALNDTYSYELVADPAGAFRLEGDRLIVADTELLHAFQGDSVALTLRATDPNGNVRTETIDVPLAAAAASPLYEAQPQFVVAAQSASTLPQPGKLAALPGGGFFATWVQSDPANLSRMQVMGRAYASDGIAGATVTVSSLAAPSNLEATATVLANGTLLVTWATSTNADVKAQLLDPGGAKIGGEFFVNTSTAGSQFHAQATALAAGGFLVTWFDGGTTGGDASGGGIKAQLFTSAGVKQGGEILVNATTDGVQTSPSVAQLGTGDIVVAWTDASAASDGSERAVRARILSASGQPAGPEFVVDTTSLHSQMAPTVAALPGGRFVVAWRDTSEGNGAAGQFDPSDIRAQIYDSQGHKIGAEFRVNTETFGAQGSQSTFGAVDIAVAPGGTFVMTWVDFGQANGDGDSSTVKGQLFAYDGSKLGGEFVVDEQGQGQQSLPFVAQLAGGDLVFAWWDVGGIAGEIGYGVSGRRFHLVQPAEQSYHFVDGTAASDDLAGTAGDDVTSGYGGDDVLAGLDGNDILDGGAGADRMAGGAGNDLYFVDNAGDVVTENVSGGIDEVRTSLGTYVLPDGFETLTGTSAGAQDLRGNGADNVLVGGDGG
ncbi:MAG: calcium-binding protein, partial [Allosphingosinicella sp.]